MIQKMKNLKGVGKKTLTYVCIILASIMFFLCVSFLIVNLIENKKININTANITQLMTLPGIGEVKAGAIIRYRQEHGRFQNIDEVLLVNGIGSGIYAQIAGQICV